MHQKRASDLITDVCEPPWGCWDLNSAVGALNHGAISPAPTLIFSKPIFNALTSLLDHHPPEVVEKKGYEGSEPV